MSKSKLTFGAWSHERRSPLPYRDNRKRFNKHVKFRVGSDYSVHPASNRKNSIGQRVQLSPPSLVTLFTKEGKRFYYRRRIDLCDSDTSLGEYGWIETGRFTSRKDATKNRDSEDCIWLGMELDNGDRIPGAGSDMRRVAAEVIRYLRSTGEGL